MRKIWLPIVLCTALLGGCPSPSTGPVTAVLAINVTSGDAPLVVSVSAAESTSTNEGTLTYDWSFGDGTTASGLTAHHTFSDPGRYTVRLTVTDATGASDSDSTVVRVAGADPTAVIAADPTSGTVPLLVRFDGTGSSSPDDTIFNYFWDFGDGSSSQLAKPSHQFASAGTYTVTLRVETAGGVEDTTTTTIAVAERVGSLSFSGATYATLPLTSASTITATLDPFTLEAWVRAQGTGGSVFNLADGVLTVEVQPSLNKVEIQLNGVYADATVSGLTGSWRHLALVYSTTAGAATLYIDGAAAVSMPIADPIATSNIVLGVGYSGLIAEARFWATARTAAQIQTLFEERLNGNEAGLAGYWPLDAGSGQALDNEVSGQPDGYRGASLIAEVSDPDWSTEGPPL